MKKIIVLIAILVFPFLIFAKELEVGEVNLKINIGDDYIVLTRDNLKNNEDLARLNIKEDYMKETMEKNNIYLDVLSKDVSYEILVVVPNITLGFNNLSNATDDMLDSLKNELVKRTGAEVSSIYKGNHNYIVVDYYDKNTDYYIVNYYTVVNAKGYNFQLQKKEEITDNERTALKKIVDGVIIKVLDDKKEESKDNKNAINNNKKSTFDFKNVIIGAVIGAVVGLISYVIGIIIKKKNKSENVIETSKENKKEDKTKKKLTIDGTISDKNKKSSK